MRKFFAVIKREYVQRVRSRMFIVATILGPLIVVAFTLVPAYLASIKAGGPTRIAVADESGKLYERFRNSLLSSSETEDEKRRDSATLPSQVNSNQADRVKLAGRFSSPGFTVSRVNVDARSLTDIKRELSERVRRGEIDVYVVIPNDILKTGAAELYGRNTGDIFTRDVIENRLTRAIRDQRLAEQNIPQEVMDDLGRRVNLKTTRVSNIGEEEDSGGGFYVVFAFGLVIYLTTLLYGQMVLGAVVEEKETRIAELLFSSTRSFPLMIGKLVGVSLVALTQLAIWGLAFALVSLFGLGFLAAQGAKIALPHIPAIMFIYLGLYFLLGYFIYATIYALVGSVVSTVQEGGQLSVPIALLLVTSFCLTFPIARSPNSSLAFWASMFPFFAPVTMLVRIVTETPPFWQILLSLAIGFATVVGLIWIAARIYRVGMLMTGKRATIPEVWRWVRQA
jgi:ABC-2 type transport system permease protein